MAGATVNAHIKLKIIRKYDFKCIYCGFGGSRSNHLTVDHVFPKHSGSTNDQDNLACCCKNCNTKKGAMLLTDFIKKYKIKVSWDIANFL